MRPGTLGEGPGESGGGGAGAADRAFAARSGDGGVGCTLTPGEEPRGKWRLKVPAPTFPKCAAQCTGVQP